MIGQRQPLVDILAILGRKSYCGSVGLRKRVSSQMLLLQGDQLYRTRFELSPISLQRSGDLERQLAGNEMSRRDDHRGQVAAQ